MSQRIHPCICGYLAKSVTGMRKHRLLCQEWRDRPDPRALSIWRRTKTYIQKAKERAEAPANSEPCPECNKWIDHEVTCPHFCTSMEEPKYQALIKHGIDPTQFEVLLRVMAKRRNS